MLAENMGNCILASFFAFVLLVTASVALSQQPGSLRPPSELRLTVSDRGILLAWTASPDDPGSVTGYAIARAEFASGPFETVAEVEKGVRRYLDGKAKKEIIYYYRVRAVSRDRCSSWSNTVAGEWSGF